MNQEIVLSLVTKDLQGKEVGRKEIAKCSGALVPLLFGNDSYPETPPPPNSNGGSITEAQTRYLFRILSKKGMEGEAARNYILKTLNVSTVRQAGKNQASALIDELLHEKEVGDAIR